MKVTPNGSMDVWPLTRRSARTPFEGHDWPVTRPELRRGRRGQMCGLLVNLNSFERPTNRTILDKHISGYAVYQDLGTKSIKSHVLIG
jgi:hypothetical protein